MSDPNTHPRAAGQTASRLDNETRSRTDLYAEITNKVIAMLEAGVVPWRSPILGQSAIGSPKNLLSGKPYRGINVFLLAYHAFAKGYESSYWVTFQQASDSGGKVKRGERSSMVIFWKPLEAVDRQTGEVKETFVLRYYNVFNASQCEGLPVPDAPQFTPTDFDSVDAAEAIIQGYRDGPEFKLGGTRAFYTPSIDTVTLPKPERFSSAAECYSTTFHEIGHSTGHSKRLNRQLGMKPSVFGSPDYSREELIAEMCAAFLCGEAKIDPAVIKNQAAYVSGWLGKLKGDSRLIISAGGAAQRAADWIRGVRSPTHATQTTDSAEGDSLDDQEPDGLER